MIYYLVINLDHMGFDYKKTCVWIIGYYKIGKAESIDSLGSADIQDTFELDQNMITERNMSS